MNININAKSNINKVILTWSLLSQQQQQQQQQPASDYIIYYRIAGENFADSQQITVDKSVTAYTITNLVEGTEYIFKIITQDGLYSSSEKKAIVLSQILLKYGISGQGLPNQVIFTRTSSPVIDNIIGNNYYQFQLIGYGKEHISDISPIYTFYIDPSIDVPQRLRAILGNGDGTAYIQWNEVTDNTEYILETRSNGIIQTYNTSATNISLNNLIIGNRYDFNIKASNPIYGFSNNNSIVSDIPGFSNNITFKWADNTAYAKKLVVGQLGIYIVGIFTDSAALGSSYILNVDSLSSYLAYYDFSGNVRWVKYIDGPQLDYIYDIAIDSTGINVVGYTTGNLYNYINVDNDKTAIIIRYDLNGIYKSMAILDGPSDQIAYSIITVDSQSIIVAGLAEALPESIPKSFINTYNIINDEYVKILDTRYDNIIISSISKVGQDIVYGGYYDNSYCIISNPGKWTYTVENSSTLNRLIVTSDSIYLAGLDKSGANTYLIKLTHKGEFIWRRSLTGYIIYDITVVYNSIYILVVDGGYLYLRSVTLNGGVRGYILLNRFVGDFAKNYSLYSSPDILYALVETPSDINFGNGYSFTNPQTLLIAYNIIKEAPTNPQIDTVVISSNSATIKWYPTINTTGYRLTYRNITSTQQIGPITVLNTSYTISNLANGIYEYKIKAYNGSGESSDVTTGTFSIQNVVPLTSIIADLSSEKVTLKWLVGLNNFPNISYKIYKKEYINAQLEQAQQQQGQQPAPFTYIGITTDLSYTLTGLINGKTYMVGIIVVGPYNESTMSTIRVTPYSPDIELIMPAINVPQSDQVLTINKIVDGGKLNRITYTNMYEISEKYDSLLTGANVYLINMNDISIRTENQSQAIMAFIDFNVNDNYRLGVKYINRDSGTSNIGLYFDSSATLILREYDGEGNMIQSRSKTIIISLNVAAFYVYKVINGFVTLIMENTVEDITYVIATDNSLKGRYYGRALNGDYLYELIGIMENIELVTVPYKLI